MIVEIWILFLSAVLQFALICIHSASTAKSAGIAWGVGRRDIAIVPDDFMRRSERCLINTIESYFVFIPLLVLAIYMGVLDVIFQTAAIVFLICRAGFVAIYLANIPLIRSLVWGIGMTSLLVMIYRMASVILPPII